MTAEPERFIYALTAFTVEKRGEDWYFAASAMHHSKGDWRGPFKSEAAVTTAIARELRREISERYRRQLGGRAA
ncbi:MAG: hypothetical protein ACRDHZ_03140 [Ktedonobacteraceae bacterium]